MVRRHDPSRMLHAILCLVLLSWVWIPASAQVENGAIAGQITIARGSFPPDRIEVTLQTRGIIVTQVWTDNEGKFIFHDLPPNLYYVIIKDEKYEYYEEYVKVNPHTNPINILTIRLTPKTTPPRNDSSGAKGENPYLADLAEYKRHFPAKVVKEFDKGVRFRADGRIPEAIEHFRAALKLAPDFYPAHNNLGAAYVSQSNFAAARNEFETVLKLNGADSQAYFNLGNVFLLTGHYDDCLRMVEEGIRKRPNSGFGQFLLGSVYEKLGRLPEAERALHNTIRIDPGLSRAHLELVNLYVRQNRTQEALGELKFFVKSFPSDPLVPRARHVLTRFEDDTKRNETTH
jgi:tetratricopeptide (TPR) repeat protein